MGLAIGEWVDRERAVLRSWPVFANFDRNVFPTFLIRLSGEDRLPFSAIGPDNLLDNLYEDPLEVEIEVDAGVFGMPKAERMISRLSIEKTSRVKGSRFMFMVRTQGSSEPTSSSASSGDSLVTTVAS